MSDLNSDPNDEFETFTSEQQMNRDTKISNRLSLISLLLHVIPMTLLMLAFNYSIFTIGDTYDGLQHVISALSMICGPAVTASYVLMIIARVKDKRAKFAKIIMWIYIIEAIVIIVGMILLGIFFAWICSQCASSF